MEEEASWHPRERERERREKYGVADVQTLSPHLPNL